MAVTAKAAMLIRRPIREVFAAFVDPAIPTKFWFTKSSGRLAPGARVRWEWEMYDASTEVTVRAFEQDKRLLIEWSGYDAPNTVEWLFTALTADTTFVSITNAGFSGDAEAVAGQAIDAMGGFTMVLAGLKALLEHGIRLNLVADRFPPGLEAQ